MAIPPPATAARTLAGVLVERDNLTPPVPIRDLLSVHANLEEVLWPQDDVDAVVIGLGQRRPDVFYRRTDNARKLRFTLAHEFGHVMIPWHFGSADCTPGDGSLELKQYGQEEQADIFASSLLIPDRWLLDLLRDQPDDMSSTLASIQQAEVTTVAALLALRRVLLAGWVFVAYGGKLKLSSVGTKLPLDPSEADLVRMALDAGSARMNGYRVDWYRMTAPSDLPPLDSDPRDTTTLLRDAISFKVTSDSERLHVMRRVNGRVGGVLSKAGGRPALETFTTLKYRMQHSEDSELLSEPSFITWIARKARDIEAGATKRTKRRK